jgi:hypothetical protein
MTKVEPAQMYLLSSLEGFEIRWDPDHKPPDFAYVTNKLGEQIYIYSNRDIWLTSKEAQAAAESLQ